MKKIIASFLIIAIVSNSCVSVSHFNSHINDPRSVETLRADVDFAHRKLVKLHPSLDRYISRQELDFKFDSLKSALLTPMTSNDFFFQLSPVIASIRQGHTRLFPLERKWTNKELRKINSIGSSPVLRLSLGWFDNRLYLTNQTILDSTLKAGTELLSIDSIRPQYIFEKYRPTFASDGFNTTFHDRYLVKNFSKYQYFEKGLKDSVLCRVKLNDTGRSVWLKQPPKDKSKTDSSKALRTIKRIQGFDNRTQKYSKTLRFADADSAIAILTIRDFTKGKYKPFYKESFQTIDSAHSKALIIDLRDNTGGDIYDIRTLYSYLAEKEFRLVTPPMVNSKTSLWPNPFTNIKTPIQLAYSILSLPGLLIYDVLQFVKTHKGKDGHYYLTYTSSKIKQPKANRFKGKVYVLINGCSFSAASVLSSNLKGSGRATFVGEETGGSTNSCVAGNMPTFRLPGSKLKMTFGLLEISTPYTSIPDGHGILPDVFITPTLEDRLKGIDPELLWVLDKLKTQP
jgi:hypothetical protein